MRGADPEETDVKYMRTALMCAASEGHRGVVQLLVDKGFYYLVLHYSVGDVLVHAVWGRCWCMQCGGGVGAYIVGECWCMQCGRGVGAYSVGEVLVHAVWGRCWCMQCGGRVGACLHGRKIIDERMNGLMDG